MRPPLGVPQRGLDYGFEPDPLRLGELGMTLNERQRILDEQKRRELAASGAPPSPEPSIQEPPPSTGWTPEEESFYWKVREGFVPSPTGDTEEMTASGGMTAVRLPGRTVFTNIPKETGGEDIGYEAGVRGWKEGALKSQPEGLSSGMGAHDFAVRPGAGSYIPSAPVPEVLPNDVMEFKRAMEGQPHMGAREEMLRRWAEQQTMRGAAAAPSEMEARAGLLGAEAILAEEKARQFKEPVQAAEQAGEAAAAQEIARQRKFQAEAERLIQLPTEQAILRQRFALVKPKTPQEAELFKGQIYQDRLKEILNGLMETERLRAEMIRAGLAGV